MSITRTLTILGREIRMSPRSGVFIMALLLPVLMTLLIQGVFGTLIDPEPRLGIVDMGDSELTAAVEEMEGIRLTLLDDVDGLMASVEANDFDAGLVLEAGFDEAVRAGERPELGFYLSGESLASNRLVIAVTTLDLIREVEGSPAPVQVVETLIGEADALPLSDRLVSIIVFYALVIAGLFVPSFSLVEEREKGTLSAVLVTPVKLSEVMLAKSVVGIVLGMIMAAIALALNGVLGSQVWGLMAVLFVASLMCVEIGMIYAALSKDIQALYAFVKGMGIILFAPVLWYIFPSWPLWIAKMFPTYWILDPIFEVSIKGTPFADVVGTLGIALAICVVLGVFTVMLARRMQLKLAA